MKKSVTLFLAFAFICSNTFAQVKKYVLLEHFTNTYCSICASQNPGFFQTIGVETNTKIHHISIHSSVPYMQCPLYQANTTEQDARKTFYGLTSTPRVSVNGAALVGAGTITAANIDAAAAATSPIELKVSETTGTNRIASISLKAVGTVPTGAYRIYAAVVEKKVSFSANNGEATHHNVLRKFITVDAGVASGGFSAVPSASAQTFTLNYTVAASWNAAQTYVVTWIQHETTKEVMNSATRFDVSSATEEASIDAFVNVSPNPTTGKTTISFTQVTPQYLTIQNAVGQVLETKKLVNNAPIDLDLSNYTAGVLFVKVQSLEGFSVKRIVKQ
jgi:hypothetical protein